MNILELETVSNIESVLPIYEVSSAGITLQNEFTKMNVYTSEIILVNPEESMSPTEFLLDDEDIDLHDEETRQELVDLDMVEGREGKEQLILHIKKERDYVFVKKCRQLYASKDKYLHCEICNFSFYEIYGDIGSGFIEVHHLYPIADLIEETITRPSDVIMVCSNCHKMLHKKKPCFTKEELKQLLNADIIKSD